MNERDRSERNPDAEPRTTGVVKEPASTQEASEDAAGVARERQDPGLAGDAMGGAEPRPRAENAREAVAAAGPGEITEEKQDVQVGGTIETALTPSGEQSMVASQLLWDGSSATSRIDESIADAVPPAERDEPAS